MRLSSREIENIINLASSEKPAKYIRQYIQELSGDNERLKRQLAFFNTTYQPFFAHYFGKFAGRHTRECILEAYTASLAELNKGVDLDIAIRSGLDAGNKLYRQCTREILIDFTDAIGEEDDELNRLD